MAGRNHGRVFICHSSKDYTEAYEIIRKIEERGVRCTIAPRDIPPSVNYADWIPRSIKDASAMIVVISRNSLKSEAVFRELELAFNNSGLPIYPVRIDPIDKNELPGRFQFYLSAVQMFDAIRPLRHDALTRLSKSIARDLIGPGVSSSDDRDELTVSQREFQSLWTRMDEHRSRVTWLWEAAVAGPLWLFTRGMGALGAVLVAVLAGLVLTVSLAGDFKGAAVLLFVGWFSLSAYLAVIGATLLRKHVGGRVERIVTAGSSAATPAAISLTALIAAWAAGPLLVAPSTLPKPVVASATNGKLPAKQSDAPQGPVRQAGSEKEYWENKARDDYTRAIATEAFGVGAAAGVVLGYGVGKAEKEAGAETEHQDEFSYAASNANQTAQDVSAAK